MLTNSFWEKHQVFYAKSTSRNCQIHQNGLLQLNSASRSCNCIAEWGLPRLAYSNTHKGVKMQVDSHKRKQIVNPSFIKHIVTPQSLMHINSLCVLLAFQCISFNSTWLKDGSMLVLSS